MAKEAQGKGPGYEPGSTGLIDVLIRGLETAKQNIQSIDDGTPRRWCVGYYADHDHSCALLYHRPE